MNSAVVAGIIARLTIQGYTNSLTPRSTGHDLQSKKASPTKSCRSTSFFPSLAWITVSNPD